MFKGFISDMDGVIADTEEFHWLGKKAFLKTLGFNLTLDDYKKFIGNSATENIEVYRNDYKIMLSDEAIVSRYNRLVLDAIPAKIKTKKAYKQLLLILQKNGLKLALVSNSSKGIIAKILKGTGLDVYFPIINSSEDFGTKTAAYRNAVIKMKLKPEDCFVLEDSAKGVRDAKNAGLYCVAIPNKSYVSGLSAADEVFVSLTEFLNKGKALEGMK
ncbi:MAG: HAD family phosphatase [Candidatus Aenigmarchaeota archaeon]|nr:HAD family phosphatase [Candidatus Aenigmarchaeota archaeon]